MAPTPPIARPSAPYDAFKGHLLGLGVTDASGNVVVECRRSLGGVGVTGREGRYLDVESRMGRIGG
ncbi:hypothetical protein BJ165DRAFT_1515370 [Panaeolus papilionaceus]|nr:hypothetical protein BJ165DRAFT_1515370 [Panaeolus papilionaceus]